MIYSVGAFPEPSNPPSSVRTLHIRGNLTGQKLTTGETQTAGRRRFIHQYFLSPAAVPPSVDRPLGGNAVPGDRERDKKQRAAIENIASLVHRFLFASTFYVRIWMFPRMGPKDDGGTHNILRSERLFPRRSTGLSGGTLPPETERAREREKEKRAEKQNIALFVHYSLFVSTFYVKVWVFPRMGPKDNGGTHR